MAGSEGEVEEAPVVKIDLDPIYGLEPQLNAATLLRKILESYRRARIIAMINYSPDAGTDIYCDDDQLHEKIEEAIGKSIDEHEGDEDVDDIARRVAQATDADMVIHLDDGYEIATAFIAVEDDFDDC